MINFEKQDEQIKHKEMMLESLRIEPMSFRALLDKFDIEYQTMVNYLNALKKYKMIEMDNAQNRLARRYHVVTNKTYREILEEIKISSQKNQAKGYKPPVEFSPYATMKVTADHYHTLGNKARTQAWQGYASMEAL